MFGMLKRYKACLLVLLLAGTALLQGCAPAATQSFVSRPDLSLREGAKKIILMPIDIQLSTLTAGGILKPEAEWTANAARYVKSCLKDDMAKMDRHLLCSEDLAQVKLDDEDISQSLQLQKLHEAVGQAIMLHQYVPMLKLPGKENFDWSLGPKTKFLKEKYGADYALFIYLRDSYASGGRKALGVAVAVLGVGIPMGQQVGFASLVDLETGDLTWFNRLGRPTGDLRTPEAASESVALLLSDFPR